jgi:hypothetical protein
MYNMFSMFFEKIAENNFCAFAKLRFHTFIDKCLQRQENVLFFNYSVGCFIDLDAMFILLEQPILNLDSGETTL